MRQLLWKPDFFKLGILYRQDDKRAGQPIAVSDVQRDVRFNQSFAQSVGYIPQSILATPMMMHERVIGVMEVLARQAAIALSQIEQMDDLNTLAELFQQIASLGDRERKLAIRMMRDIAQYAQDKTSPSGWGDLWRNTSSWQTTHCCVGNATDRALHSLYIDGGDKSGIL